MRYNARLRGRLLFSVCLTFAIVAAAWAQDKQRTASDAEFKEAKKVETATDAQARLLAAGAFLKKYPKSELRPQVAQLVAAKINDVTDPAQKVTLAENFRTVVDAPNEADLISPVLLNAYIKANRLEHAFKLADSTLDRMANPVGVMLELVSAGNNQVRQQNVKFIPQSIQYAGRVIELIET